MMNGDYALDYELKIDNGFRVDGRDFTGFSYPEPVVKGWSSLFGGNGEGSVTVEAEHQFPGEEYPTRFTLASTKFADYGQKPGIVKHYKNLVAEWNEDNRDNWLKALRKSVEYVASHHERQVVESRRKLDVATANLDWLASEEQH